MAALDRAMRAVGTRISVSLSDDTTVEIGKLSSIGEIAPDSDELEITTLDSTGGYREYLQGFKDSGELALEGYYAPGNAGQTQIVTLYGTGESAKWKIEFPDGTTVGFNAYVKGYKVGAAEVEGAVGFGATLRVSGAVTVTPDATA